VENEKTVGHIVYPVPCYLGNVDRMLLTKKERNCSMFKKELVEYCAKEAGTTKKDAEAVIEAFVKAVEYHPEVSLRGFGTFKHVVQAARTARNPRTGEAVAVPEKTVLKFKAGK